MKTLTIEDAALELAALLDIETPDGDSSPEFRLQFARTMRKPDIEAALIAAATDGALRLRHVDGGYVPAGVPVSVSSQVSIDEARAALEADGWPFVSPNAKFGAGAAAVEPSLTEIRITAIVEVATRLKYDPLCVATGGKAIIEAECLDTLRGEPHLFTPDTFKKAWQAARDAKRVDVENAETYRRR